MTKSNPVQILVRSGLCLSCSGQWYLIEGRVKVKCASSEKFLNKCPRTSCRYHHQLALGKKPPKLRIGTKTRATAAALGVRDRVQVLVGPAEIVMPAQGPLEIPDRDLVATRPSPPAEQGRRYLNGPGDFLQIGDIARWVRDRGGITEGCGKP